MKKRNYLSKEEKEINKKVESGEIKPVHIPGLKSSANIMKYMLCSEIVKYKKKSGLTQSEIGAAIEVNKSEISKICSYQLDFFSIERLLGMVESLIRQGANIHLNTIFNEASKKAAALETDLRTKKSSSPLLA
ncbi:MAG: XRE family transcriptional regulator [Bacteriovoracia bacterium]